MEQQQKKSFLDIPLLEFLCMDFLIILFLVCSIKNFEEGNSRKYNENLLKVSKLYLLALQSDKRFMKLLTSLSSK